MTDSIMMSSLMGMGGQSIIMKEIVAILNSFRSAEAGTGLAVIMTGVIQIIVVIAMYRLIQNPEILTEYLGWIGWRIFRRGMYRHFRISSTSGLDTYRRLAYEGPAPANLPFNLPIETAVSNTDLIVSYIPWIHSSTVAEYETSAQAAYASSQIMECILHQWNGEKYAPFPIIEMYPSRNCLYLQAIIERSVLVCSRLKQYKPICFTLNGEPGLGKTASLHFIAACNSVRNIYRCDLSSIECLDAEMELMFNAMYHQIPVTTPTIFLIDEIDKWLDYQIASTYSALVSDQKPDEAAPPSKDEYSRGFKSRFLHLVLAMAERNTHTGVCIIIFACNNFDSIFEGIPMTHFHSLQDRFQPLIFERCHSEEIRDYLRYVNTRLDGTIAHVSALESILETIPDLTITYRRLHGLAIVNQFDPAQIAQELQQMALLPPESMGASSSNESSEIENSTMIRFRSTKNTFRIGKRGIDDGYFKNSYCKSCYSQFISCDCGDRKNDYDLIITCHFCHARISLPPLKARKFIPFSIIKSTIDSLRPNMFELMNYVNQDDVILSMRVGNVSNSDWEIIRNTIVYGFKSIPPTYQNATLCNSVFKKWTVNYKSDHPLVASGIAAMTKIMVKSKK